MILLLDTHTLLWFLSGDRRLSNRARKLIEQSANDCFVSITSLWEIVVKTSVGKLELKINFNQLTAELPDNDIQVLPIEINHLIKLSELKFHHRDPFDRLIIAQSIVENFHIISRDENFSKYKTKVLW